MPASGKSSFAKVLSEYYQYPMIDLDQAIVEKAKMSISEIFTKNGEEAFRMMESELLREISETHDDLILSTGGGTPCFHDGIHYMNQNGFTVFLEAPAETLIERLMEKEGRPLMQGDVTKKVKDLLTERLPYYRQAQVRISHREPRLLGEALAQLRN